MKRQPFVIAAANAVGHDRGQRATQHTKADQQWRVMTRHQQPGRKQDRKQENVTQNAVHESLPNCEYNKAAA